MYSVGLVIAEPLVGAPLADRLRPRQLDEFVGQSHLVGPDRPLTRALEGGLNHSLILWGPPGTGKTTLARLIAGHTDADFIALSAVFAGVKEIRSAVASARELLQTVRRTVLFVDEVHRFNKAQQDAFLPYIEDGTVLFIGATTENPSFELNNALLSRARVYVLKTLTDEQLLQLVARALEETERGLGDRQLIMDEETRKTLVAMADGDGRRVLNLLELAADMAVESDGSLLIDQTVLEALAGTSLRRFDKGGEAFYDQISALHKAVRGSSPDAALYWFARMLDGGCEPLYIGRRMVRMASEDIGNADPRALRITLDACEAYERLGSPEGELALAQAVVFLAVAAKSNAVYSAFGAAMSDAKNSPSFEPPLHLRNAPTKLMKQLDYGKGYRYAHDEPARFAAGENYFPEEMGEQLYYHPVDAGLEIRIGARLAELRGLDRAARKKQLEP